MANQYLQVIPGEARAHPDMVCSNGRSPILDDDQRPTNATPITRYVDCSVMVVDIDTNELVDATSPSDFAEIGDEAMRSARKTDN